MTELADLERRISQALDRIALASETLAPAAADPPPADPGAESALREALEAERAASAQLSERLRRLKEKQEAKLAQLEKKLARANEQLDVQGFELQRLKRANAQMAEANRKLIETHGAGQPDPGAAMRALQAELDSERAARKAEIAEMEEIIAELRPLLEPETVGARHG